MTGTRTVFVFLKAVETNFERDLFFVANLGKKLPFITNIVFIAALKEFQLMF